MNRGSIVAFCNYMDMDVCICIIFNSARDKDTGMKTKIIGNLKMQNSVILQREFNCLHK